MKFLDDNRIRFIEMAIQAGAPATAVADVAQSLEEYCTIAEDEDRRDSPKENAIRRGWLSRNILSGKALRETFDLEGPVYVLSVNGDAVEVL